MARLGRTKVETEECSPQSREKCILAQKRRCQSHREPQASSVPHWPNATRTELQAVDYGSGAAAREKQLRPMREAKVSRNLRVADKVSQLKCLDVACCALSPGPSSLGIILQEGCEFPSLPPLQFSCCPS